MGPASHVSKIAPFPPEVVTTQVYVTAPEDEVVASILAHYIRRSEAPAGLGPPPGYRAGSLEVLFGATS